MDESEERRPDGSVVTGLYWDVKRSFVSYVAGNPDGQVYGADGAETDGGGTFRFPLEAFRRFPSGLEAEFAGEVRFVAHGGLLSVPLVRPAIRFDGDRGELSVSAGASRGRVTIADVAVAAPAVVGEEWLVFPPLATALTAEGAAMFGDVYPQGEPFEPVRVALPAAVPVG